MTLIFGQLVVIVLALHSCSQARTRSELGQLLLIALKLGSLPILVNQFGVDAADFLLKSCDYLSQLVGHHQTFLGPKQLL